MARYPARSNAPDASEGAGHARLVDSIQEVGRAMVGLTARCIEQMDMDITLLQHRALVMLVGFGPQRVGDFARELGCPVTDASRFCEELANKDLAVWDRRAGTPRDHRLRLTGRGRRLIGELMRLRRAAIQRILEETDVALQPDVVTALHAFAVAVGEPDEVEWWRHWRSEGRETRRDGMPS